MNAREISLIDLLIVIAILLLIVSIAIPNLLKKPPLPPPVPGIARFTIIGKQTFDDYTIEVILDKETHQEIVCVSIRHPQPSCYLTGRIIP